MIFIIMMRYPTLLSVTFLFWTTTAVLLPSSKAQPQPACSSDTISIPPMPDFRIGMMVPKWWYIQEIYFRKPEEVVQPRGSCVQQHTQLLLNDRLLMLREDYTNLTSGEYNQRSWFVESWYPAAPPAVLSILSIWLPETILEYQATYVFTDYETYGVMHYCSHEGSSAAEIPGERIVVMTGSSSPSETLLGELKEMVASLGFPTEHAVKVSTANCTYCWGPEECPYYYDDTTDETEGKMEETDF